MRLVLALLALFALALPAWASPAQPLPAKPISAVYQPATDIVVREYVWYHGTTVTPGACPYGTSLPDGCPGAPVNGSFTFAGYHSAASFSAYAIQSGQTWTSAHPWTWNAPGVDYAIGYPTGLILQDPSTATTGTGQGQLPAGCNYLPTGRAANTQPQVYCDLNGGVDTNSPTINGFDFSLHNCIALIFSQRVTGTITVENSNFKNGSNCNIGGVGTGSITGTTLTITAVASGYFGTSAVVQGSGVSNFTISSQLTGTPGGIGTYAGTPSQGPVGPTTMTATGKDLLSVGAGGTADLVLLDDQFDGGFPTYQANLTSDVDQNNVNGKLTVEYTAFVNSPQRPLGMASHGDVLLAYNAFDGWVLNASEVEHGEVLEVNVPSGAGTQVNVVDKYNTTVTPSTAPADAGTTTFYFTANPSTPGLRTMLTNSTVDHNVIVNNCITGQTVPCSFTNQTISASLSSGAWGGPQGTFVNTNNFADNSGATYCFRNDGGAASVHGSTSGNTLTVTSVTGSIYDGAPFSATGFTTANIVSDGTGTGATGTYIFDGAPQTVGAFTNGTTGPQNALVTTFTNNISLTTGNTLANFAIPQGSPGCN